jgi:hypothetical protein
MVMVFVISTAFGAYCIGSMPTTMGQLTRLLALYIYNNGLTGTNTCIFVLRGEVGGGH